MASQAPLPLQQTLASEMTLFELDESLSILMESATDEAANNNGEIPEELRQALLDYCEAFGAKVDNIATTSSRRNSMRGMPRPRSTGYSPAKLRPKTRLSA